MTGRARRRLADVDEDAGVTLVELLVVLGVLSILSAVIGTTAIVTLRTSESVEATASSTAVARSGQDRVLSLLRWTVNPHGVDPVTAPAFVSTGDTRLEFYSQHDQAPGEPPVLVALWVDEAFQLHESVTTPTGSAPPYTYAAADSVERVLVRGLTTRSIFSYYADAETGATPLAVPGGETTDPAFHMQVASIGSTITVNAGGGSRTPPVILTARVDLPNVEV